MTSVMKCPMTSRAATAAGNLQLTTLPSGALSLMGLAQTFVIRYVRTKHAFHGHKDIGIGEIKYDIATPIHLGGRSIQVHEDLASFHLNRRLDHHILLPLHLLHDSLGAVNAVRDLLNLFPHAFLGAVDDLICQVIETIEFTFLEHLANLLGADVIGCNLGSDVSDHLIGCPHVPADHLHDRRIEDPSVVEFHEGDEETLFKDVVVVRGDAASDIRVMKDTGRKSGQSIPVEDGAHHTHVIQMACQCPGVIRDEDIAGLVGFRGAC